MKSTEIREKNANYSNGFLFLFLALGLLAFGVFMLIQASGPGAGSFFLGILSVLGGIFFLTGLFVVNPNEYKVLQLFGAYAGTVKKQGLKWANPFYTKTKISVRVRNFETGKLKVTDLRAIPWKLPP